MRDHLARVIGVRIRDDASGTKFAVRGSGNGLFLPRIDERELVIACEGETDTAAALSLDFYAIGRPGCSGGTELFLRWLRRRAMRDVVVVADSDGPGIQGAYELVDALSAHARSVRVVIGPRGGKDLMQAVRSGYTRDDLLQDIETAMPVQPSIRGRGREPIGGLL